jgi:hypothetical protein
MIISDKLIEKYIKSAGTEFDSHDIIHKLAHDNQKLYIKALSLTNGERPFQTLHSELGKRIKAICEHLGYTGADSKSLDIFGQQSNCVRWSI